MNIIFILFLKRKKLQVFFSSDTFKFKKKNLLVAEIATSCRETKKIFTIATNSSVSIDVFL